MKVLRGIGLSLLIVLFLTSGVAIAQDLAKKRYLQGVAYAVQGKFEKAKQEFEKALNIDSSYEPAKNSLKGIKDVLAKRIKSQTAIHMFRGVAYGNKGQTDRAIREFTKALEINPKYAAAYYNRGGFYKKKGQHDQAISDYAHTIKINPRDAEAFYNRGNAYGEKGNFDLAIADFNQAISINPRHAKAYYNRGITYGKKDQYRQAISDYNMALDINPRHVWAYNNRGLVYMVELGNKRKGCSDFKKACELGECRNYNHAKRKGFCE